MKLRKSVTALLLIAVAALASEDREMKSDMSGLDNGVEEEQVTGARGVEQLELRGNAILDDVTIISGTALDNSTKEAIRSVLKTAGHAGEIMFLIASDIQGENSSGDGSGGIRKIKVSSSIEDDATN